MLFLLYMVVCALIASVCSERVVRVDFSSRIGFNYASLTIPFMEVWPEHMMYVGWAASGGFYPREATRTYANEYCVWGVADIGGGIQGSVQLRDVPAAWIRENFADGLLAGAWLRVDSNFRFPVAVIIRGDSDVIMAVDAGGLVGPSSADWSVAEESCKRLLKDADVYLVFNGLSSLQELCGLQFRSQLEVVTTDDVASLRLISVHSSPPPASRGDEELKPSELVRSR